MPQAVIADFVEAGREDVLEKASNEFVAGHCFLALAVGCPILVSVGDGLVVDGQHAVVGDGDAEGVAGEIVERRWCALAPGRGGTAQGVWPELRGSPASGHSLAKASRKRARARVASADLGNRKVLPAECQAVPSSDNPPPVTRQWTWGWKISRCVQVCSTASTPTVPPIQRGSRPRSMIAVAAAFIRAP